MEQLTMFDDTIPYPQTYADIEYLYNKYIYEGEKDSDTFSYDGPKDGSDSWRSYYFYGKKVFSFYPHLKSGAKFKLWIDNKNVSVNPPDLPQVLNDLCARKHDIFRNTITDVFACCNDFKRCSAAGSCLHQDNRFYNGCYYRKNLESGLNFYKEAD